ncbi:DegT/DnrJ/EryC1/StrS family aminotransferase [Pseudomonas aeruginosa]|uniref:DegT/DnrJ/EryC1/StrS family aminotransferase n=2 Tax=Pseudomonas aeruginosa TaxID=287 RepID=UPI0007177DCD|nr:DegT/DnrJ/EryC1/StrS family aminotransferase [Pseudomonas aeruginosa]KRV07114.1 glutamine--scyllo-inositol aminotransferase [Pseudomonas aeruginosa]KRV14997.1 glutamine--scyllo-inositol aminotransferase [Pseudomonas aeruginosa]RTU07082.1 DegT/DnrJ/EryC1/StrS family aminotransferase [Pseudomonas aeruginosa]
MHMVTRYNYPQQFGADVDQLVEALGRQIVSGNYILGEEVEAFERAFADYVGSRHCIGVNSGTDALILSLMAMGIGPGDEVVTHANTFYATVAAICLVGATPVLVDADPQTFLMDISQLEASITARTRAIIPVHLFGKCTSMQPILAVAHQHGLKVIEDAAQSHGARIDGRSAGSQGDTGCFSFHPSKNLAAAGDAGAIVTDDAALAERLRVFRSLGQAKQNQHVVIGLNSKLDALQARILSWKLPHLERWNEQRRQVAKHYREALAALPVTFQAVAGADDHVYHLFQLRSEKRDRLLEHLVEAGVDVTVRYPTPIHLQPAFEHFGWRPGQFPVAERLALDNLCLPLRPNMSAEEISHVCDSVAVFFRS